jgi:hypothetical protein
MELCGAMTRAPMLPIAALLALSACGSGSQAATADSCSATPITPSNACTGLFGIPNEKTGLGTGCCQPSINCGTPWKAPTYDAAFIASLVSGWKLDNPFPPLTADPYPPPPPAAQPPPPPDDPVDMVCGVKPTGTAGSQQTYRLVTYDSDALATADGAHVTHFGHCGVCSTLANLAVYMRENDLTEPVRACGISSGGDFAANVACLEKLGFDLPCAQVWAYNTAHTRAVCLDLCMAALCAPYHLPDGRLNDCILCDEEKSGAIFKNVAGRTRRNSGLPNALCRPCSEVRKLEHAY